LTPAQEGSREPAPQDGWERARREEIRRFIALSDTKKFRLLMAALEFARAGREAVERSRRPPPPR
jgi:hypothetical protein